MTSGRTYYQVLWHEYSSHNLDDVHGVMSFTYASREIKNLLTVSGRILEIWTYHKARELGFFDDVSGLEVKWG